MISEVKISQIQDILRQSDVFTKAVSYKHNVDNFLHIRKGVTTILNEWEKIKNNQSILDEFLLVQKKVDGLYFASQINWRDITTKMKEFLKNPSLILILESLENDIFLHLNSATSIGLTKSNMYKGYFTNSLEKYIHLLKVIQEGKKIEKADYQDLKYVGGSIVFELEGIYNLTKKENFISNGIAYDFLRFLGDHSMDYSKMGDASGDYMEFKNQFESEIEDYRPYVEVDTPDFDFLTLEEKEILQENLIADRIAYVVQHSLEEKKEPVSKQEKISPTPEIISLPQKSMKNTPLNQILYGPPGTGKTYHSINHALSIIEEKSIEELEQEDRTELLRRFNEYRTKGQVVFTTFHQSFSYEDFIEGLKAKTENGEVKYEVVPGIFKKVCETAKSNYSISQTEDNESLVEELLKNYSDYIDDIQESETTGLGTQYQDYKGVSTLGPQLFPGEKGVTKESWIIAYVAKEGDSVKSFHISNGKTFQVLSAKVILRDYSNFISGKIKSKNDIKPSRSSKSVANGNADYFFALYQRLKEFDEENNITKAIKNEGKKNYVLIIDEINRGNISKIFGELITLIETSKRYGNNEAITAKLPYSGEQFTVPNNLYIIGTMNTTDRSIALMDIALRRRFSFVEMSPQSGVLSGISVGNIDIEKLFITLNERIEFLYDRDHLLGQAFFLPLKTTPTLEKLNEIFQRAILPLLQEYFYEDGEKIQIILGDHTEQGWKEGEEKIIQDIVSKRDSVLGIKNEEYEDKVTYRLNPNITEASYIKIYEHN
ncbi:MAG: McrB family protein [Candidatus Altimarinota bacterium]